MFDFIVALSTAATNIFGHEFLPCMTASLVLAPQRTMFAECRLCSQDYVSRSQLQMLLMLEFSRVSTQELVL